MTQLAVRGDVAQGVIVACGLAGLRIPSADVLGTGSMTPALTTLTWTPDLTVAEQATLDSIIKLAVGATLITKAERDALEPSLLALRTFQQLSQNDFIALAQNARDRQLFDTTTALIRVIRAFLRDT